MRRLKAAAVAMAGLSAMTLGGCSSLDSLAGGAGSSGPGAGPYPETASTALARNTILSSNISGANKALRMQVSSTTPPAVDSAASVSIAKNGSGGYDVTVDGQTTSFAATDQTGTPGSGGTYFGSYARSAGSTQNYMTLFGTGTYSGLLATSTETNGTDASDVFAAVGSETDPTVLTSKANASYSGRMVMTVAPDAPASATTTMNAGVQGDVTLNADFGAGNVWGNVNNLAITGCPSSDCGAQSGSSNGVPASGTISMGIAPITGNTFAGPMSGTGTFGSVAGTYSGEFYGPTGQEAAGVLSGTAAGFSQALTNAPGGPENDSFVGGFTTTQQ